MMLPFAITEPAADAIRKEVVRSSINKPVVYLLEMADGKPTSGYQAERKLVPCLYSRLHFLGLFLVEISGIVFFLPPSLKRKVVGGTLDIQDGRLVIADAAGRIMLPKQSYRPEK